MTRLNRRLFVQSAAAAAALISARRARAFEDADLKPLDAEIARRHDEAVQRLQNWIRQPAIAAENRGMDAGCDLMMSMLKDAGFGEVKKANPKVRGFDGGVRSQVEYLYELAAG